MLPSKGKILIKNLWEGKGVFFCQKTEKKFWIRTGKNTGRCSVGPLCLKVANNWYDRTLWSAMVVSNYRCLTINIHDVYVPDIAAVTVM